MRARKDAGGVKTGKCRRARSPSYPILLEMEIADA